MVYNKCMQILIAEHSGFCEGVERAYKIAIEQAQAGRPVFMLGNLVHNSQVVERLGHQGIKTVNSISDIPKNTKGILLISAHGVVPEIYEEAKTNGLEVVDTTCPWVKNAQRLAKEISAKGLKVLIIGDKDHPEVKGILGWAGGQGVIVQNIEDLKVIDGKVFEKGIGIVAQTTQSQENFDAIVDYVSSKSSNLVVHKTICGATSKRQTAAIEIAKKVDIMLVVGDQKSANTKRLAELCSKTGTETHHIQTQSELRKEWLFGKGKIGITAGASTPEWVVSEIINLLQAI